MAHLAELHLRRETSGGIQFPQGFQHRALTLFACDAEFMAPRLLQRLTNGINAENAAACGDEAGDPT